jgi:UDP-2,4-diacetamido-2,4,6-trideoxy-beta-L-altropyranose hydrolase
MSRTLIIRADASVGMGIGHVMRCLALAQGWQDSGGKCAFVMSNPSPPTTERLRREGFDVCVLHSESGGEQDARELATISTARGADCVVVDGYQFGAHYQDLIKAEGLQLLFIDDNGHAEHYSADAILNQNIHAHRDLYPSRAPHTELLLGLRYAMLRREFTDWKDWHRQIEPVGRSILVTMGGSDPENVTAAVIRALRLVAIKEISLKIVLGGSNPHYVPITVEVSELNSKVEILQDVDDDMPGLMAWADIAISAAGSTCWELCLLGLPSIVIPVAPNQRVAATHLDELGAAHMVPNAQNTEELAKNITDLLLSYDQRQSVSRTARALVDGEGTRRVVSSILKTKAHSVGHN